MYDLLIKNGTVVDGTRQKPFAADVAVKDGRIVRISTGDENAAAKVIDAAGLIVSPGFIDIHSHCEGLPFLEVRYENKLLQGITTELGGNCGGACTPDVRTQKRNSFATMAGYAAAFAEKGGYLTNMACLSGHAPLRVNVLDYSSREPSPEELERMKHILEDDLRAGSFGMSLGLIYPPSAFGKADELMALAEVIRQYDGILAVHMRSEGPRIFEAVDEMLTIAEKSGVHLQISHLKLMGRPQWGQADELLEKIEEAQARGVNVTCDQYPFPASNTNLTALLPDWAQEGGWPETIRRINAPTEELEEAITERIRDRGGAESILIANVAGADEYNGKRISEIAREAGLNPTDAVLKVLRDGAKGSGGLSSNAIYFCINEEDILRIMQKTYVAVGTDGHGASYDEQLTPTNQHPRNYGTFPRFFQYVREKGLMQIEDAVYKCTGLPAKILGLPDRGVIREGAFADLTVFDSGTIRNRSEFLRARQKPEGIRCVIVNGVLAAENNEVVSFDAGRCLLKKV